MHMQATPHRCAPVTILLCNLKIGTGWVGVGLGLGCNLGMDGCSVQQSTTPGAVCFRLHEAIMHPISDVFLCCSALDGRMTEHYPRCCVLQFARSICASYYATLPLCCSTLDMDGRTTEHHPRCCVLQFALSICAPLSRKVSPVLFHFRHGWTYDRAPRALVCTKHLCTPFTQSFSCAVPYERRCG